MNGEPEIFTTPGAKAGDGYSLAKKVAPDSIVEGARIWWSIRNRYNPLAGLTPDRLASAREDARVGFLRTADLIYEQMEESDPILATAVAKRKGAVSRLDWSVAPLDGSPEASAQAEALEAFWQSIDVTSAMEQDTHGGVALLLEQMMHAIGHRYSVHEVLWRPDPVGGGLSAVFNWCPTWMFEARGAVLRYLTWDWNLYGIDRDPNNWLVTVGPGLMSPTSVFYLFKHLGLRDWVSYSAKFGIPSLHLKTSAGTDSQEWADYVNVLEQFGDLNGIITRENASIEVLESKAGASNMPQPPLVEYVDQAIISLWRGGDLSTKSSGPDAVGASLQSEESDILQQRDAGRVLDSLHYLEKRVIAYLFGEGTKPLAEIRLKLPKRRNLQVDLLVDTFLVGAGVELGVSDALERYERREAHPGDAILQPPAQPDGDAQEEAQREADKGDGDAGAGNSSPAALTEHHLANLERDFLRSAVRDVAAAANVRGLPSDARAQRAAVEAASQVVSRQLAPLRRELAAAAAITDPARQRAEVRRIAEAVPAIFAGLAHDRSLAAVMEQALAAEAGAGSPAQPVRKAA